MPPDNAELVDLVTEILDRARRTETRVTRIANHFGVAAGGDKPVFTVSGIIVPSRRTSIEDIMQVLPEGATCKVYCGKDYLLTVGP